MLPRVVIIGGGFGGICAARALRRTRAQITLIDKSNHHLFQPLLYQVATAGLSPADIAAPIRGMLRNQSNADVLLAEVSAIDTRKRRVHAGVHEIPYDYLILATGATHSYFGHEEWERNSPGLKSIADATRIRRRILTAFESADAEADIERRRELLTFVIVGAGPTGVELAGAISELANYALARDFRHIDPKHTRIILIEASPRILNSFPEDLAQEARRKLERFGVEVWCGARVEKVDADGVVVTGKRVHSRCVIWAAGVVASPAGRWLGVETDRAGRVKVSPDLSVPGHPEIFAVGDTASATQDGQPLPGVAPVAMQAGSYAGRAVALRINGGGGSTPAPFRYRDKGNLATVGRSFAVAKIGRIKLAGRMAWFAWMVVHIYYLIGFRNRVLVMLEWAWAYVTFQRGARLIVGDSGDS